MLLYKVVWVYARKKHDICREDGAYSPSVIVIDGVNLETNQCGSLCANSIRLSFSLEPAVLPVGLFTFRCFVALAVLFPYSIFHLE